MTAALRLSPTAALTDELFAALRDVEEALASGKVSQATGGVLRLTSACIDLQRRGVCPAPEQLERARALLEACRASAGKLKSDVEKQLASAGSSRRAKAAYKR